MRAHLMMKTRTQSLFNSKKSLPPKKRDGKNQIILWTIFYLIKSMNIQQTGEYDFILYRSPITATILTDLLSYDLVAKNSMQQAGW